MRDESNDRNGFGSHTTVTLGIMAMVGLAFFYRPGVTDRHPVVDLRLCAGCTFTIGTIAMGLGYLVFFGGVVIFPLWLQTHLGDTAMGAGLAAAAVGVRPGVLSLIVGRDIHRPDRRLMTSLPVPVFAWGSFGTRTFPSSVGSDQLIGYGIALAAGFVPTVTMMLSGLPPGRMASATGLSRGTCLPAGHPLVRHNLWGITRHGLSTPAAANIFPGILRAHAAVMVTDDFLWLSGWIFPTLLILIGFAKPPVGVSSAIAGGAH